MSLYPDGMPEWAKMTEAELRGEDPRPSVRAMRAKVRARLGPKTAIAITNAAPVVLPSCRCVINEESEK